MNDFKNIKIAVAGTVRRSEYSNAIISAPSCNSGRCNPREGGETQQ